VSMNRHFKITILVREYISTHCNNLQHTATHCKLTAITLQTHCNTLQHTATHCNTPQHTATHRNTLQHTATHCNTLQHTATHCNTLQHIAAHCNTLQHIAAHNVVRMTTCKITLAQDKHEKNRKNSHKSAHQFIHYTQIL